MQHSTPLPWTSRRPPIRTTHHGNSDDPERRVNPLGSDARHVKSGGQGRGRAVDVLILTWLLAPNRTLGYVAPALSGVGETREGLPEAGGYSSGAAPWSTLSTT